MGLYRTLLNQIRKKMKRLLLLALTLVVGLGTTFAVPAKRGVRKTLTLNDGTRVEATLTGDEHVHYYLTDDHRAIQRVGDAYQFVSRDSLQQVHLKRLTARNKIRANRPRKAEYKGQKKGLVILVEFSDIKFTYDKATFNDYFNKVGFNLDGMKGSVHDYFYEQSYGQFDLEFDVVGPVKASYAASYYAGQNSRVAALVNTLCKQVDDQVDYNKYDWDGDGVVDQVYVIYAGYGEAQGAENTIWPHEWTVAGGATPYKTKDGPSIYTYGISCELMGDGKNNTGHLDGIGTSCHEFSHCLGFPDFYDTSDNGSNFGMGAWDLMDYGCYNGDSNGHSPSGYTAYERWVAGWLEPVELNASCQVVDMPAIQDEPRAYVLYNDANHNEYYLLANHQLKGFDAAAGGHGLLVIHADYNASAWASNRVNVEADHQRMTIIPADNTATSGSLAGDPFPGTRKKKELSNTSTPRATLYNENTDGMKLMNKPISGIDETAGLVSFNFMGGVPLDAPIVLEASNITASSFVANWQAVDGATDYTISLTKTLSGEDIEPFAIFEEDFEKFTDSTLDPPDVSASLDDYTNIPGWTGSHLYTSKSKLRVGKKNYAGELISPIFEAPLHDTLTVLIAPISAARMATTKVQVRINAPERGGYLYANIDSVPLASSKEAGMSYILTAPWSYGSFQIAVYPESTEAGIYMDYLAAIDGLPDFDDDEKDLPRRQKGNSGENNAPSFVGLPVEWTWVSEGENTIPTPSRAPRVVTTTYTTTATSYEFTNLEPASYSYKVRANTTNGVSPWSDEQNVPLADGLYDIRTAMPKSGRTYMLDGRQVESGTPLRPGIYVRDGKKFLVR